MSLLTPLKTHSLKEANRDGRFVENDWMTIVNLGKLSGLLDELNTFIERSCPESSMYYGFVSNKPPADVTNLLNFGVH